MPGADIDATQAWDRTIGDPSTVVADIDSGYFFEDPDLANALLGWDTLYNNGDATDDPGVFGVSDGDALSSPGGVCGSLAGLSRVHTAGTIGAVGNNAIGISGVDPNATIMPIRALDSGPAEGGTVASVVAAINYAGMNGARVVNMSINAPGPIPTILSAEAAYPQTLFVAAAGNSSSDDDNSPEAPCGNPAVAVTG